MVKKHLSRFLAVIIAFALSLSCLPLEAVYAAGASESKYPTLQEAVKNQLKSFENYNADDEVEFIVELEGKPLLERKSQSVSLQSYLNTAKGEAAVSSIEKEQSSVKKKMLSARSGGVEIEFTYRTVLNGFAVKAKYSEKERLESIAGVKNVYVAQTHEYVEPTDGYTKATHTSGALMDSDRANEEGYTGKGTVTAVLDTGLDVNHSAFANAPESPRYTLADVEEAVAGGELNAESEASALYKSEKIPFAYDYADKDSDVSDSQGHGTHVSGSVGADCEEFTGVAPDTQIMMMKVFSDSESGASDSWILAALEDCVVLGVDTINMSLGSAGGFTSETGTLTNEVYGRVEAEGINLLCAAGNDTSSAYMNLLGTDMNLITNPDNGVVGSPSTYKAALSVASINEDIVYTVYFKAGENKILFNDASSTDDTNFLKVLNGQTLEYVTVPGYGDASDFASVDVQGKIALVARGSIAFTEKEQNAKNAGAVAMIVFDNVEGELPNMQSNGLLPMVSISKADGKILRDLEEKKITVSEDFAEDMENIVGGQMSDFSSLGVAPDLTLKPEITAPGGSVYSTLPGGSFGNMSGTSMASPHMAGAAAVVKQYVNAAFPELSATQKQQLINQLVMSTAVPVTDPDGVYYTPRKQGAGLAQIYNAIHTNAYLTVEGCDRPKAELKDNENGTFSFTFTIHNISDSDLSYDVSAVPLTAKAETLYGYRCVSESSRVLPESEFTVDFSQSTVTVPANGTASVTVSMQLTEEGKQQLAEFTNGTFLDGFVMLSSKNDDNIDLSLPYLGFYGDWSKAPIFDATIYDEAEPSTYDMGGMYLIDYDWTGYPLGVNLISGDMSTANKNKVAIASHQLGYQTVFPILGMFRGSKETNYVVTNAAGNKVFDYTEYESPKSFYYANGDFITYNLPSQGWQPIYLEDDGYYYYLPDGQYTYTVTGHIDGKEGEQSVSFPVMIDNTAPELISHRYYVKNGTPYLEVTMKDNHYMMGIQLCNEDGSDPLGEVVAVESSAAGAEVTYTFDLTDAAADGEKLGTVVMMDYAQNISQSDVLSLTSQDVEPVLVQINQQQITCMIDTQPFQLDVFVYPDNAIDKSVVWSSDDPDVASVSETGVVTPVGGGETIIRATACNGVQGTTTVSVGEPISELPEDFVIREDGSYQIPANLNRNVLITDNAHNVRVIGDSSNTSSNPYNGLSFTSENDNLNLTVQNMKVTAKSASVITFKGEGNTLTLRDENSFTASDNSYSSKALINVPEDSSLTVKGSGTLNLYLGAATYGAGIGANAGKISGTITIDSGKINGTSYGSGALIGGTGYGAKKITINGGRLNLDVPYKDGWPSNLTACGAAIGDGNTSYRDGTVAIEINGGEINGSTAVNAAVIGTGHGSTTVATVTINGGKLNLKSVSGDGKDTTGGACIGTGDQATALGRVTINGGEIIVSTESGAAAIGGGAGTNGCTVMVNGGTITASTSSSVPAIGRGSYISSGTDGAIMISGGSLKATSASETVAALPFGNIQNDDYDDVFETLIYAPNVKSVTVDGVDWKVSGNHPEDDYLHLWLAEGTHYVAVETENGTIKYEVVVTPTGKSTATQYFDVTYTLTDLTTDGSATVYAGETLSGTLTAADGKQLPENIAVTIGGWDADFTYDATSGAFSVANVSGDVVITAAAVDIPVDKTALNAAIAEAETLDEEAYTSGTWAALEEALEAAKTVAEDTDSTQSEVDEATENLKNAMDALVERGDKTALNELIAEAEALDEEVYTSGTWAAFEEALEAAKAVAADADALQDAVDEAADALREALDALVERGDKTALNSLIAEADELAEEDYTTGTWATFADALENAKTVAEDADATQTEIDEAKAALAEAMENLIVRGDKSALNELIDEAEALDEEAYTSGTWAALEEALEAAKAVAEDADALQDAVDEAADALREALDALVERGDKTALNELIAEAEALEEEAYTSGTWAALEEALEAAKAVAEDADALQDAVDEAADALREALDALVERGDKSALNELIDEAEALDEEAYTSGTWAALEKALEAAKAVAEDADATQEEADAAKAALEEAMNALVERGDKSELDDLIDEAEKLKEEDYTADSWSKLEEALEEARKVAENEDATHEAFCQVLF